MRRQVVENIRSICARCSPRRGGACAAAVAARQVPPLLAPMLVLARAAA